MDHVVANAVMYGFNGEDPEEYIYAHIAGRLLQRSTHIDVTCEDCGTAVEWKRHHKDG